MSRWRLAVLLELAARDEADAGRALAAAHAAEARRREERAAAAALLVTHGAARAHAAARAEAEGNGGPVPRPARLGAAARHLSRLDSRAAELARALGERDVAAAVAAREADARCAALSAARSAVAALERHREWWRAAKARRLATAEDAAADELVSARRRAES